MIRNVSMKTTEDHSPITIIGYNNNKKFLIIHPPTKEGGRMPKVEKQSFLPLHKCFKKKLRISECLRCGSQPYNYPTILKLGVEEAKWRCGNCGMATRIKLQETPPLVPPPHEVKNDILETKSKGKRCTSIESDNVFEVEKIIANRDEEGGK
jgi:transcription elongation factor Elf1